MTLAPNDKGHVNQVANHSGGFSMLGDKTNFLAAQLLYTTCLSVRLSAGLFEADNIILYLTTSKNKNS